MKKLLLLFTLVAGCAGVPDPASMPDAETSGPDADLALPDAAQAIALPPQLDGGTTTIPLPPTFASSTPADGAVSVAFADPIVVRFSTAMDEPSTIAAIDIQPAIACTAAVTGAVYSCAHPPLAPLTQYKVSVHAGARSAAGLALASDTTFSFTTAAASVASVSVNGAALREVRQSAGITQLALVGSGLSTVTSATLGSLPVTLGAVSDSALALSVMIPSGAPLGDLPLVLSTPTGLITVDKAITLSPICAAAGKGDDAAAGTRSAPFSTLRRALGVAGKGDTISLAEGTYSANEAWPQSVWPIVNVPDGLHVVGASQAGTILSAPVGSSSVGLVLSGNVEVSQLTLRGFQRGVLVLGGTPGVEQVAIENSVQDGIDVQNGTLILNHVVIDHSGAAGIAAWGNAYLSLTNVQVTNNATSGVSLSGSAQMNATPLVATGNGTTSAKSHSGVYLTGSASMTMSGVASSNAAGGIVSESTGSVSLVNVTASSNGTAASCQVWRWCSGVALLGGSLDSRLSDVTASSNRHSGVLVDGAPQVVTITGSTLTHNSYDLFANSNGLHSLHSNVTVQGSVIEDGSIGVLYGDYVALDVSETTLAGHIARDIESNGTGASTNSFVNCRFGSDTSPALFPSHLGTVTLTAETGGGPNEPSWQIADPSINGAPLVFTRK